MRKRNIGILIVLTMLFVCVGDLFILDLYGKHGRVSETKEIETSKDSLERAKFKNGECEYLVNISRKDLDIKLESNESFWVYVGRPSCPDCQVFYSELETILNKHQKNIFYYDTTCKASQKKDMSAYVQSLNVCQIPAILRVENGKITVLDMQTDSDIEQFEKEF